MSGTHESAVRLRYARASQTREACLCAASNYDASYLSVLPAEIIERDYGCGDPSQWVAPGETVLDLGSGGGKICYICAQKVGFSGKVIGVDFNPPMLDLARKYQEEIGDRLGYHNVEFRKARIQDLRLDLEQFEQFLSRHPANDADSYLRAQEHAQRLRTQSPLIADQSIDVIVSNCVLNLVDASDKRRLFEEMFRVLKVGGRCAISDIVSDEDVPAELQQDPELWSGCVSGAFREDRLLSAFEEAGFYGMKIVERSSKPWRAIRGIQFRSITVQAFKGKQGACLERKQAVIYKGPWRKVADDDGHTLERGQPTAVCDKTFALYQRLPYREDLFFVEPRIAIPPEQANPVDCRANARRAPRQIRGMDYDKTVDAQPCCGPECCG